MVSTRSGGARPKQAKLEELDGGPTLKESGKKSTARSTSAKATAKKDSKAKTGPQANGSQEPASSRKRKAHQPPTPPPEESQPSDRPEEENRPRKVPKGSVPSDPVGAARRAAETRRKDPRGGAPEARSSDGKAKSEGESEQAKSSQDKRTGQQQRLAAGEKKAGKKASDDEKAELKVVDDDKASADQKPIMINRSPVLTLWGACVTAFMHPDVKWEGCLSAGAAIATLCAVSKGRAIGKIEPKDDQAGDKTAKKEERKKKAASESEDIHVMHFPLPLKNDKSVVMVSGKPKNQSEDNLMSKFGGSDAYEAVRSAMEKALQTWKGDEETLDGKAFGMYEKFRPNVPSGGGGWGRKGELRIEKIEETVAR